MNPVYQTDKRLVNNYLSKRFFPLQFKRAVVFVGEKIPARPVGGVMLKEIMRRWLGVGEPCIECAKALEAQELHRALIDKAFGKIGNIERWRGSTIDALRERDLTD
jgi:hypothetical protein